LEAVLAKFGANGGSTHVNYHYEFYADTGSVIGTYKKEITINSRNFELLDPLIQQEITFSIQYQMHMEKINPLYRAKRFLKRQWRRIKNCPQAILNYLRPSVEA